MCIVIQVWIAYLNDNYKFFNQVFFVYVYNTPTPQPSYKRGFQDEVYQIMAGLEGHGFSYNSLFRQTLSGTILNYACMKKKGKVRCKCCMYLFLPSTRTFRPFELYENEEFQPLTCFVSFAQTNS